MARVEAASKPPCPNCSIAARISATRVGCGFMADITEINQSIDTGFPPLSRDHRAKRPHPLPAGKQKITKPCLARMAEGGEAARQGSRSMQTELRHQTTAHGNKALLAAIPWSRQVHNQQTGRVAIVAGQDPH